MNTLVGGWQRTGVAPRRDALARPETAGRASESSHIVLRRRLDWNGSVGQFLRVFRDRERLAALVGEWVGGGALIGFDPIKRGSEIDDLGDVPARSGQADGFVGAAWIGSLGYQLGRGIERLPAAPRRPIQRPDGDLAFYDHIIRLDRASRQWWFESVCTDDRLPHVEAQFALVTERIGLIDKADEGPLAYEVGEFTMTPTPDEHQESIGAALEHIAAGDIFQVNLCTRLEASFAGDPLDLFAVGLAAMKPAYAAYVAAEDGALASFSPELFLRREGRYVTSSPIKGTAPLSSAPEQLATSVKDQAENVMIVDLVRNDLGRVSVPGTVRAPETPRVERHAGVWHLVADVRSHLRPGVSDADLVNAAFPPGSVTGAPKVRAMEIINALEPTGRETYTGAIGWAGAEGMELNVVIRTFEFGAGRVWFGVGGGIVAGSTAAGEMSECLVKAAPPLAAIGARLSPVLAEWATAPAPSSVSEKARRTAPSRRSLAAGMSETALGEGGAVLLVDGDDVLETDHGSIFLVDDDGIHTPPLDGRILAGTTRARVVESCQRHGIPVSVRTLTADDLERADEVLVTSALDTVRPLAERQGLWEWSRSPGPVTRWLAQTLRDVAPIRQSVADRRSLRGRPSRVLLIDNYDSFVFNLAQYCEELGAVAEVVRNDEVAVEDVEDAISQGRYDRLLISPGPGSPDQAGISTKLIRQLAGRLPILGVCLGHQCIGEAFGASVVRAPAVSHGCRSIVNHDGRGVYSGMDGPIACGRYHSLVIKEVTLPPDLVVTARTPSGLVMGVRHRSLPIEGVQVHPESVLTARGHDMIENFLSPGSIGPIEGWS